MNRDHSQLSDGILFTDQYQLTMAQLYFTMGIHEKSAQFDHFFRNYPDYGSHQAGYCINAGLEWAVNWMQNCNITDRDINYLKDQKGETGERVFRDAFLSWLRENGNYDKITMLAIPEGRVVHPNVPLTVIQGPLAMAQILESGLLNKLNYQTLIATKAARIKDTAREQPLLEFGLRRGQDSGVNAGVRAALIGGADFSSNVGISHFLGYPPKGTHGHSMVQVFISMGEGELGAFRAYAELYPDDCLLLVDTISTLESGIPNAIVVFEELRRKGHEPVGIRLDSGDLAYLSIQAAAMLDKAGFPNTKIVLSNQIDELVVWQIITQIEKEAPKFGVDPDHLIKRLVYGVGTSLITSQGAPALDGVYKLVALSNGNDWTPSIKLSESREKTHNPGTKNVWRIYDKRAMATADLITVGDSNPIKKDEATLHHPTDHTKVRVLKKGDVSKAESLLEKILDQGKLVYEFPSIEELRKQRRSDMECLDSGIKRIVNPHIYHVSLSDELWNLKEKLIASAE